MAPLIATAILSLSHAMAGSPSKGGPVTTQPIPKIWPISPISSVSLGVTTSLTTSGYNFVPRYFFPPYKPGLPHPDFVIYGLPTSFTASFALTNHTFAPIDFTVPVSATPLATTANAVPSVVFSVYDDQNNFVWSSWTNPGDLGTGSATLPAGGVWKLTAQIPLQINFVALSGSYTLVATVNGTPEFSATAAFKVSSNVVVDPPVTASSKAKQ